MSSSSLSHRFLLLVVGCLAGLCVHAAPRTNVLLDDDWQLYRMRDFDLWPSQAQLSDAQIGQLKCPPPGKGWEAVRLPNDYAVDGEFSREANAALRAGGAIGRLGGREFEVPGPGAQVPRDGKAGALGRPGRDAYAGHGYLPVYPAWYRRTLSIPASSKGRSISLDFGGAYRNAVVFINGRFIAQHPSGYTGFRLDISDAVKFGEPNEVAVFVDPRWFEGWWYEGAGLYRHVRLLTADSLHIAPWGTFVISEIGSKITHDPNGRDRGSAKLTVLTTIENRSAYARKFNLISRVADPAGHEVGNAASPVEIPRNGVVTFRQEIDLPEALLWSLEAPNLYRVQTVVHDGENEIDGETTTFGIRSLRFDPEEGFFLNERPVKIYGVCSHHDFPAVGVAVPDNLWDWRIAKLKEMGANAYRCAHNPVSEAFYEAADRMGMLVMDEARHFGDTYFPKANATTPYSDLSDMKAMVLQHRNHPSIIMWSLANEEGQGPKPHGAKIFAATKAVVKAIDPTRPTTGGINGGFTKDGYISVEDILGMNYHNGEFDRIHREFPYLMIFGSEDTNAKSSRGTMETSRETGRCSQYGDGPAASATIDAPGGQPWSSWVPVAERKFFAGQFIWTGFDYRGEPNPFSWPATTSQTGAMDLCGFPKPVYYYWKAAWKPMPSVYIFPDWNLPETMIGKPVRVRAFSNCERVELSLNGKVVSSEAMPRNRYLEWKVPYEPGKLSAVGYNGTVAVARWDVETAGAPTTLRLIAEIKRLSANGQDVAPIRVELLDAQGRLVPNADRVISFTISGAGALVGTNNGDPASHESNASARRSTFRGLCLLMVRANEYPGTITAEARAPGIPPAKIEVIVAQN